MRPPGLRLRQPQRTLLEVDVFQRTASSSLLRVPKINARGKYARQYSLGSSASASLTRPKFLWGKKPFAFILAEKLDPSSGIFTAKEPHIACDVEDCAD